MSNPWQNKIKKDAPRSFLQYNCFFKSAFKTPIIIGPFSLSMARAYDFYVHNNSWSLLEYTFFFDKHNDEKALIDTTVLKLIFQLSISCLFFFLSTKHETKNCYHASKILEMALQSNIVAYNQLVTCIIPLSMV